MSFAKVNSVIPDANTPTDGQTLLALALTSIANAIFITDSTGCVIWVNEAFCRLSGYAPQDIVGHSPSLLQSGRQDGYFYRRLWRTIQSGKVWHQEIVNKRKDGTFYTVEEIITPLYDANGKISHFIAFQHDLGKRRERNQRQQFLAYHDSLTGLINRPRFMEQLEETLTQSQHDHCRMALLFIDLDHFKEVNDQYGHTVGDRLLKAVARRLRSAVRQDDIVARLGGDEFTVIVKCLSQPEPATLMAEKLVASVGRPYHLANHSLEIGASIGIALYPEDGDTPTQLLEHADEAMYRAKQAGRDGWRRYGDCLRTNE
ncbi:sensor domain-containing diguanylate cyclase [Chitinimonas arctica]|uniref:sensor domain-containing diguanylate cyclase n=1 Tax=Chitinimonas arctica TaxID=2594795 RepID=UPI0015D1799B|nr:sensor domain-containing diguanylate cyclase [Chitinimonas arctica]